jgi:hypothetical protein
MLKDPTYHIGLLKTYMYENSNFEKKMVWVK